MPGARAQQCWVHKAAYDRFLGRYQDKYPKACECLRQDRDVMFAFDDFPAAHWVRLRTTNPAVLPCRCSPIADNR